MPQHTGDELIKLTRDYLADSGVSKTRLGTEIAGNNRLIIRPLRGDEIMLRSGELASIWYCEHWPLHLPWPAGVPRFRAAKEAANGGGRIRAQAAHRRVMFAQRARG